MDRLERSRAFKVEDDVGVAQQHRIVEQDAVVSRSSPQRRRSVMTGSIQSSGDPVKGLYLSEK